MSKQIPFLYRRGDAYTFRIAVPIKLRSFIGCRELTKSLRTSDKHLALPRALELAATCKRLFFDLKEMMSDSSNKNKLDMATQMRIAAEQIRLRWAKEEHEAEVDRLKEELRQEKKLNNAKLDAYKELLNNLGLVQQKPVATSASTEIRLQDPLLNTANPQHKLSEIIPYWITAQSPAKSSIVAFKFVVSKFEKLNPKLTVETTQTEHVEEFIETLQKEQLNPKTISKNISFIRALFNTAKAKKWIKTNPAIGHKLPSQKSKRASVRGYRVEEMNLIFSSPVFTQGARPTGCKGEAAYWIPLLLLFTGARREEICQLTSIRIRVENGVNVLDIDTIDEDDLLKTASSIRVIPIHEFLINLGFLDFVSKIKNSDSEHQMLFPLLAKNARGHYGQKWGDWWGKYIKKTVGITDSLISPAHSFRHSFITECRRAQVSGDCARALTGHSVKKQDDHDGYGETPIETLAQAMNKIEYPGIKLNHLIK